METLRGRLVDHRDGPRQWDAPGVVGLCGRRNQGHVGGEHPFARGLPFPHFGHAGVAPAASMDQFGLVGSGTTASPAAPQDLPADAQGIAQRPACWIMTINATWLTMPRFGAR